MLRAAALLVYLLTQTPFARSEEFMAHVVKVSDGDSITVITSSALKQKIRLAGIDAPEIEQPFGEASKAHLSTLLGQGAVHVVGIKKDRYGRLVAKVMVSGQDVSLAQIEAGLAWHYKRYQREQPSKDAEMYSSAEQEARRFRRGLWYDLGALPPWTWRKLKPSGLQSPPSALARDASNPDLRTNRNEWRLAL